MKSANDSYSERLEKVCKQLENIKQLLECHVAEQGRNRKNWGYVGDLGAISEQLAGIEEMFE